MTPLQIEVLLQCVTATKGNWDADRNQTAANLLALGMIEDNRQDTSAVYQLTERGQAFVHHICKLPLPEAKWEMPG